MPQDRLTRTVRFWRFRAVTKDGQDAHVPLLNFTKALEKYQRRPVADRRHEFGGDEYLFDPRDSGSGHLAVHKMRNPLDFMAQVSRDGAVSEIMAVDDEGNTLADTSAVSFLSSLGGRVFGIVGGNQSAPRAGRVAEWVNAARLFEGDLTFSVVPLTAKPQLEALTNADGARRVTMTARSADLTDEKGSDLYATVKGLADEIPDVTLTITLSSGHGIPSGPARTTLGKMAAALSRGLHGQGRGQASIVREVPAKAKGKTRFQSELVDLVEYQLATEFDIASSGAGVNIDMTLANVDNIASRQLSALRGALGVEEAGG